jgi:arabinose-5-phosphate isomerase
LTNQQIIKNIALDTIQLESKSILDLSKIIDSNFCDIIDTLKECQGKIVLTGIGKSAIIGMKISATLNSTGSKSIFLHLGDALHGDMGVIGNKDVVICISKSGESDEIISLSNHLNKNKILLIGISCVKNSSLDKLSAMTLQKLKGFTPNDFSKYHPSGNLGKQLSLTLMNLIDDNRKPIVKKSSSFLKIIDEISSNMYGATAILDGDRIAGIITDGDIRRVIEKKQNIENICAKDFMNHSPKIMNQNTLAIDALKHMKENNISQILILNDNDKYVGIVHILDIIKQGISYE